MCRRGAVEMDAIPESGKLINTTLLGPDHHLLGMAIGVGIYLYLLTPFLPLETRGGNLPILPDTQMG